MSENIQRNQGRSTNYKFDRGGVPAEFGPYIGVVKNNIDPTRSGRLQVYIEQFAGDDPEDKSLWRTVMYIPPFYGVTPRNNATGSSGDGTYKGNQQSYGMWFTPPDIGVQVICFFVAGDPNQGYYVGCVPEPGITHMIPAVGASRRFVTKSAEQQAEIDAADAQQMPVVEINSENEAINENPRFFDQPKPIHDYVYAILLNQGLLGDYIRGPISSSSQRESPSAVFGMSTPGRAIYQGGLTEKDIKDKLDAGTVTLADVKVEGRRGGHSIVMDDGDLRGRDNLIRIRTAKGHQITMSDEADCFYFIHANGQTWIELGSEGTVDVYSTNSVNVRSQGEINLHADKNININAGENLNIRAGNIQIESQNTTKITSGKDFTLYGKTKIGVLSDGSLALQSDTGGWKVTNGLTMKASRIDLNGGPAPESVTAPKPLVVYNLDDTKLVTGQGWQVQPGTLETIAPRAPTHEPYPYHNRGVPVEIEVVATPAQPPTPAVSAALASTATIPVTAPAVTNPAVAATAAASGAAGAVVNAAAGVPSAGAAAINAASVLKTSAADVKIGSLNKADVTGLLAQAKTAVGQASNVVSLDKGIGQFGFKPDQLEAAKFLKPGTLSQLNSGAPATVTDADIQEAQRINSEGGDVTPQQVAQNRAINAKLASPTVWTGAGGVTNLQSLLNNSNLQNLTQQNLMTNSLKGLQNLGLATGKESAANLSGLVQSATKLGIDSVNKFVKGIAPPEVAGAVGAAIKGAQFATDFVQNKLGEFTNLTKKAQAAANTVDRAAVDAAVVTALGDSKIPAPEFKPVPREEFEPSQFADERDAFDKLVEEGVIFIDGVKTQLDDVVNSTAQLDSQDTVTTAQIDAVQARLDQVRSLYNSNRARYLDPITSAVDTAPAELKEEFRAQVASFRRLVTVLQSLVNAVRNTLASLRERAVTST